MKNKQKRARWGVGTWMREKVVACSFFRLLDAAAVESNSGYELHGSS